MLVHVYEGVVAVNPSQERYAVAASRTINGTGEDGGSNICQVEDLARRLERVETESALQRLASDYCIGADHDEEHRFRGIEAIVAAVQGQWSTFPRMQHAGANHIVDLDPDDRDRATGRSDVVVTVQFPDGRWVIGGAVYDDIYRRQNGVWRIAVRWVLRSFDLQPPPVSYGPAHVPVADRQP